VEPRPLLLSSQLNLLGNAERVVDLDPEVTNRAFELRMPEQQLNRSQVARLLVDLGGLRSPHRMRAVGGAVEPGTLDPGMDDPRILPGRDDPPRPEAAREEVSSVPGLDLGKPGSDRGSGLFGSFELNRPAGLFLNDGCAVSNPAAGANIVDLQSDEITASELASNGEIEQREVTRSLLELEPPPELPRHLSASADASAR